MQSSDQHSAVEIEATREVETVLHEWEEFERSQDESTSQRSGDTLQVSQVSDLVNVREAVLLNKN